MAQTAINSVDQKAAKYPRILHLGRVEISTHSLEEPYTEQTGILVDLRMGDGRQVTVVDEDMGRRVVGPLDLLQETYAELQRLMPLEALAICKEDNGPPKAT